MALSREQVAEALRYSLEVVKRVENGVYQADVRHYLARWQAVYGLDDGLRELWARVHAEREARAVVEAEAGREDMRRDTFLKGLLAGSAAVLAEPPLLDLDAPRAHELTSVGDLMTITGHYRRLEAHTPSGELAAPARAHLDFISGMHARWPDGADRRLLAAAASEAAGLAGWLATDQHDHTAARTYYRTAIAFATRAESGSLRAYQLGTMAAWSVETGEEHAGALRLVEAARSFVPADASPTARAWLLATAGVAHAVAGDTKAALAALDQAEAFAHEADGVAPQWPWLTLFDRSKVQRYRATCYVRLRLGKRAAPVLDRAIEMLPPSATKQRALLLADRADVTIDGGDIDHGAELVGEVFTIAIATGSRRAMARVRALRGQLAPWEHTRAVRTLDRQLLGPFLQPPKR